MIYYERSDVEGPKLCSFEKTDLNSENVNGLVVLLSAALGKRCEVNKVRKLFLVGQTRVHVDNVEGLGNYMELEVRKQSAYLYLGTMYVSGGFER